MSEQGLTLAFTVDQSPAEAFAAINNVRGWWSTEINGPTDQVGAEFTYRYQDLHRARFRLTEAVPDSRVSWLVEENYFSFTTDSTEWTGTSMHFDIAETANGQTEVRFTHQGLVPEYECYSACRTGWEFYVQTSLRDLISNGIGQPSDNNTPRVPAEQAATADS